MNVLHSDIHFAKSHTDTYHAGNKVVLQILTVTERGRSTLLCIF